MRILVTGATGFVGTRFCRFVYETMGWKVLGLGRRAPVQIGATSHGLDFLQVDLTQPFDLTDALKNTDVLVHLASRVHRRDEAKIDRSGDYELLNIKATEELTKQAKNAGVKRIVFVSTIKVNGEKTFDKPFSANDVAAPLDLYAKSKFAAEQFLLKTAEEGKIEVVILRPTLVYGAGVKANFQSLMRLISWNLPLPFGSVFNRRSVLYIDNFCAALVAAAVHPEISGKVFTLADDGVVSTADMARKLAEGMGKTRFRLLHVPVGVIRNVASLFGLKNQISKLLDNLETDNSEFKKATGWKPKYSIDDGLRETAKCYLTQSH